MAIDICGEECGVGMAGVVRRAGIVCCLSSVGRVDSMPDRKNNTAETTAVSAASCLMEDPRLSVVHLVS